MAQNNSLRDTDGQREYAACPAQVVSEGLHHSLTMCHEGRIINKEKHPKEYLFFFSLAFR